MNDSDIDSLIEKQLPSYWTYSALEQDRLRNLVKEVIRLTTKPVRIYDYVWPQNEHFQNECVYACSYTPGQHLAKGELFAVVHPNELTNWYLKRDS